MGRLVQGTLCPPSLLLSAQALLFFLRGLRRTLPPLSAVVSTLSLTWLPVVWISISWKDPGRSITTVLGTLYQVALFHRMTC
ncbi:hypothetical protein BDV19DRAFT_368384 [Aspergillus venezuelensis]